MNLSTKQLKLTSIKIQQNINWARRLSPLRDFWRNIIYFFYSLPAEEKILIQMLIRDLLRAIASNKQIEALT